MIEEHFSFRWGIPWLDWGYLQVPSFFFRYYAELGITRSEFLLVLHLANFKYESSGGMAYPSLQTIADQMGYSIRQVQRLCASLEEKGYLRVIPREGRTSIYHFEGLALALLKAAQAHDTHDTPDTHVRGTPDTHVTPPLTPMSPEEQETTIRKQQQQPAVASSLRSAPERARQALLDAGVEPHAVERLLKNFTPTRIMEVVTAARSNPAVQHLPAYIVAALDRGFATSKSPPNWDSHARYANRIAACAYYRNPQLGTCPGNDPNRKPWAWCSKCERQKEKAPP